MINWKPNEDPFLKDREIEIHEKLHKYKKNKGNFNSNQTRIEHIQTAEQIIGKQIRGEVLDIGSGNGYSSVYLSKRKDIKVYSMECNVEGVDLIDENFKHNKIDKNKYETVLGSFNNIPLKDHFDFILSLGTLHHSSNLYKTLSELYSSLRHGGYIIAHEPYMDDTTQNEYFINKSNNIKNFQGIENIREGDRDDHFFRRCEWLTACYHSGFEVNFKQVDSGSPNIYNFILMLKKPLTENEVPHKWL